MIGDKQPPLFEKGQRLTAAALNQISAAVLQMLRRLYGTELERPADIAVILDGALAAATDAKTGAASATATVCEWDGSDYAELSRTETVWNHSESHAYDTDTFGFAMWIDGHWVFSGDCAAMGAR